MDLRGMLMDDGYGGVVTADLRRGMVGVVVGDWYEQRS